MTAASSAARSYDGETKLPATVTWSKDVDGVRAVVDVSGAAASGLRFGLPRAHLADGVNLLTGEGPRTVSAAAGAALAEGSTSSSRASRRRWASGRSRWSPSRVRSLGAEGGPSAEGSFEVRLRPTATMPRAPRRRLPRRRRGGRAALHHRLRQAEPARAGAPDRRDASAPHGPGHGHPCAEGRCAGVPVQRAGARRGDEAGRRSRAQGVGGHREARGGAQGRSASSSRPRRWRTSRARRRRWPGRTSPPRAPAGPLEQRVGELVAESTEARRDFNARGAGADSRAPRSGWPTCCASEEGYEPMAAMFLKILVERYGDLRSDPAPGPARGQGRRGPRRPPQGLMRTTSRAPPADPAEPELDDPHRMHS